MFSPKRVCRRSLRSQSPMPERCYGSIDLQMWLARPTGSSAPDLAARMQFAGLIRTGVLHGRPIPPVEDNRDRIQNHVWIRSACGTWIDVVALYKFDQPADRHKLL